MYLSPEVALVQHSTGVLQISGDYFENGITFFTNLIYSAIRFAVGSGETAPFIGHNAFLRWRGGYTNLAVKITTNTHSCAICRPARRRVRRLLVRTSCIRGL